jgi:DNA-binding SARP family transcriptional activator/predicted ATPase
MISTLHIHLLGEFRLSYGDTPITTIDTSRLQSLLAYLMLHRQSPQSRTHLAFLFWPDSTEAQARTNLRKALHQLRRLLPEATSFLNLEEQILQWRAAAPFTLDIAQFEEAVARADQAQQAGHQAAARAALEEAVKLYRGDLLPDCYDEWLLPERERLRQWFFRSLERLIQLLEDQRDYQAAIRYAQRLLRYDPLHEATHRQLMCLYALSGDRARAMRAYHTCATVLQRELAVEPGPTTREVYQRLLKMATPAAPTPDSPTILAAESPLVGRQPEWQMLKTAWRTAANNQSHFVLVTGEAGIGKTRLVEELQAWAGQQGVATARTRSYAAEGRLAYAPVIDWLRSDVLQAKFTVLDEIWLTELARLLPELVVKYPDLPRPEPLTENWQRQRLFEALARAILTIAGNQPLLLVIDDLQWCDQETLEWLHFLLRFDPRARLLVASTMRSEEVGVDHPLRSLLLNLRNAELFTEIELGPLNESETKALAEYTLGAPCDPDSAAYLYRETEGNPLFVVEMMRARVGRGESFFPAPLHPRTSASLPPKVQTVIETRLAQLSPQARELASLAATVGRAFTFDVLAQAADSHEDALVRGLDELWQRRIIREQGVDAYDFSHDKIRDVVYARVSIARRRLLHRRVAQALETVYASNLDAVSGQVAAHYEQAGLPGQAIPYYQRAAEAARRLSANEEAIRHLSQGLVLLKTLPDISRRRQLELDLQINLGPILMSSRGYAASEVEDVYIRALELCQQMEETSHLFPILWGLHEVYLFRAEYQPALEASERCLDLAQSRSDPNLILQAHHALWSTLFFFGKLAAALEHAKQGIVLYDPQRHYAHTFLYGGHDPGLCCRWMGAQALCLFGYPDQALKRMEEALSMAKGLSPASNLAGVLINTATLHQLRREAQTAKEWAKATIAISAERGYPTLVGEGMILHGWALAEQGQVEVGITQIRQGLAAWQAAGLKLRRPQHLSLLATAYEKAGQGEKGLAVLSEALEAADRSGERWWEAELYRLKGELLLVQGATEIDVEACFRQAIEIAQRQEAKSLELRATVSMGRLWQKQGKHQEARQLLAEIYSWFTEGFNTPDLQEARTLLEQLS